MGGAPALPAHCPLGRKEDKHRIGAATLRTIGGIVRDSRGRLNEDSQMHWDMALGALRLWQELTGPDMRAEDLAQLEELFEGMPVRHEHAAEDEAPCWEPSPILVLRRQH